MQKWEYDFVHLALVDYADQGRVALRRSRAEIGPFMDPLKAAGRDGWEAVGLVPSPDDVRGAGWVLLKRPLGG